MLRGWGSKTHNKIIVSSPFPTDPPNYPPRQTGPPHLCVAPGGRAPGERAPGQSGHDPAERAPEERAPRAPAEGVPEGEGGGSRVQAVENAERVAAGEAGDWSAGRNVPVRKGMKVPLFPKLSLTTPHTNRDRGCVPPFRSSLAAHTSYTNTAGLGVLYLTEPITCGGQNS